MIVLDFQRAIVLIAFDYGSLLMAVGASGAALCFTLSTNWLRQRSSGFLMTWALAIGVIVMATVTFSGFTATGHGVLGAMACVLLMTGFIISFGGMVQFRDGVLPVRRVWVSSAALGLPLAGIFILGFEGAGFWLTNLLAAVVLVICGDGYWKMRAESPVPLIVIALLHHTVAFTFLLCALVGLVESPVYLANGAPENWAERVNLIASVIAVTGIGGLLITVHQERISRRHQDDALLDPLTGLSNRRALFERFESGEVPAGTGLIIFDLDGFKQINDSFGHLAGDNILRAFAAQLEANTGKADMAVRLGGEEFALVLPESSLTHAMAVADRIRLSISKMAHDVEGREVHVTVSAGVAYAEAPGKTLDRLMRKADNALYLSKRNGRNRVTAPAYRAA